MLTFDTHITRVCVLFIAAYVVLKVVRVLSTVVVMLLCMCLPMDTDNTGNLEVSGVMHIVGDLVLGVCSCVTAFVVQTASSVVYSMYIIYPLLILSLMLSVLYDQYDVVVEMAVLSYNRFVSTNALVTFFRHTLWFAKLFGEMGLPVYNFIVHVISGVNMELFKAIFFDSNTRDVLFSVFTGIGTACVELAHAMTAWIDKDFFGCRYNTIRADMDVLYTHECMQYGPGKHRSLELGAVVFALQTAVSQGTLLIATLCPAVASFTTALVYPVYDAHMQDIVENAANLFVGCAWTVWDVTHTRCRFAMDRGLPSTLCVPDVAPLFHFAHQIALDTGDLVDNWFNIVNIVVMKFFMERASDFCAEGQYDVQAIAGEAVFVGAETRLVALTAKLLAMTDGASIIFASANDKAESQVRENAFLPAMDMRYGFVGVEYSNNIQQADVAGDTTTGLMGCRCASTVGGAWIECHVALYDRIYDPANVDTYRKIIPVTFEGSKTAAFMQCSTLRITVQAVRFSHKQYDFMPTGFYGDRPAQRAPLLNCLVDPDKCNDVDAIIYVAPLCTIPGHDTTEGGTLACISALKDNFCFPYCVGLHQRRSGSSPITLYSEKTLSSGVYMTNMDCSPSLETASTPDRRRASTATYESESNSATHEELLDGDVDITTIRGLAAGFEDCNPSPTHNSLLRAREGCLEANAHETTEGACLGASLAHMLDRRVDYADIGRVAFADLQPVVTAGDTLLVPKCHPIAGGCEWTTSVMRLTSDVQGQYSIQPKISRVPSIRADPRTIDKAARVLLLPRETMDYQKWYNPAAQTETGIFYALNPDTGPIKCAILQNCFQVAAKDQYITPRVLFTEPSYQCTKKTNVTMGTVQARLCSTDLTREVVFAGEDRFWSYDEYDGSDGYDRTLAADLAERNVRNLFVEDVQYYNALNVVVAVRRGPVADIIFEIGHEPPPAGHVRLSTTIFYFVNTVTLEARRASAWSKRTGSTAETTYGMLCPGDTIMPPFASAAASFVAVWIKAAETVVNQFVLNIIGVVEAVVSRRSDRGVLCMHGTQDHYALFPCTPGPLSIRPVYTMFLRFHSKMLKCTKASLLYVSYLIDLPMSEYHWSQGAAFAFTPPNLEFTGAILRAFRFSLATAVGVAADGAISTFYGTVFMYEHIALPYFKQLMFTRYSGNTREDIMVIFYTLSNTVHEAVTSSALDNTLLLPAEQSCLSLAMLTGDSARPLGKFVQHSCLAIFEGVKAAVRLVPSVFTLTSITNCLCADNGAVLNWASVSNVTATCQLMIPPALHAEYYNIINGYTSAENMYYREKLCVRLFDRMQTHISNIPSVMFTHVALAATASASIPQQLVSLFNIPGLDAWSCGVWQSDIGVVTIVPQPASAFKKCAYTRTCRSTCGESINWFLAELESTLEHTKPPTTGRVRLGIPMWVSEERIFSPVLVQDYGPVHGCRRWIAVLGQTYSGDWDKGIGHEFIFLCQSQLDPANIFRHSSVELSTLRDLGLDFGVHGFGEMPAESNTVFEMWFAPLGELTPDGLTAVLVFSATTGTNSDDTGLYEVRTSNTGVVSARWLVRAKSTVSVYTRCTGIVFASGLETVHEPSAVYPVNFEKFVMVPLEGAPQPAAVNTGYRMFGRLSASGLSIYGVSTGFRAMVEITVRYADAQVQCRAAPFDTSHEMSLARYLAYGTARRTMYMDTLGRLLSIGKVFDLGRNKFSLEYHNIVTDSAAEVLSFSVEVVQNFTAGRSFKDLYKLAENRRYLYSRGTRMDPHAHTSTLLTVHDIDNEDADARRVFSVLESSASKCPNIASWIKEITVSAGSPGHAKAMRGELSGAKPIGGSALVAVTSVSVSDDMYAEVKHTCDYMDCVGCSTLALQRSCYQAQRCAVTNCVGTPVNTNNVMCVVGSVMSNVLAISDMQEEWMLGVELMMGIVRKWILKDSGVLHVEGFSSILVQEMCEFKDLLATLSAVIPSLYYTIYAGVLGGDAISMTPSSRAYLLVQRGITPLQKLQTTELVTAMTSLIFQFVLILVTVGYNYMRIVMCFFEQIMAFASEHVNIVTNIVGEIEGEQFCLSAESSSSMGGDYRSSGETDAQMLQRVVREGSFSGVAAEVSYPKSRRMLINSFATTGTGMIVWQRKMPQIMFIASLGTVIDWIIGVMYGITRIVVALQDPECEPTPMHMAAVVNCVCGDDAYDIPTRQATSHETDGALWCTGLLRMVDSRGLLTYVHNSLSLQELTTELERIMPDYLECIATQNSDYCAEYRLQLDYIMEGKFHANSVTAINVLTQCRANYADKTWDDGLFALFNAEIRASVLVGGMGVPAITETELDVIKNDVLVFLCAAHTGAAHTACASRGAVVECLRLGPEFNSIQHCMSLHFALKTTREAFSAMNLVGRYAISAEHDTNRHTDAVQQNLIALNRMEYFSYKKRDVGRGGENADACAWASSSNIKNEIKTQCDPSAQQCAHGKLTNPTQCALNMIQSTSSRSATSNPVSLFMVEETDTLRTDADISNRYNVVKNCALNFIDPFIQLIDNDNMLADMSYDVLTSEGDLLHRILDCVVLGPLESLDMLPSTDSVHVEQLTFARDNADALLNYGVACPTHALINTEDDVVIDRKSTICGSGPRIAAISYIQRDIYTEDAARIAMTALITRRIDSIRTAIANVENYGCSSTDPAINNSWSNCCRRGVSSDNDCNFNPNALDLRTTITSVEILREFQNNDHMNSIQFRTLNNSRMWTKYSTEEYAASTRAYDGMLPELRKRKVSFPVNGILDESDLSYTFPFSRAPPYNMSMAQQCHALLRVKAFSAHFAEFGGNDDNEEMLTIPAIKEMLARGEQWEPLQRDVSPGASPDAHMTRAEMIHRLLASEDLEDAFAGLYDARFVSLESRFCPRARQETRMRTMGVDYEGINQETVASKQDSITEVKMHGFASRNMGAAQEGCPCFEATDGSCKVSLAICGLSQDVVAKVVPEFDWKMLCDEGLDNGDLEAFLPYQQGPFVRAVLVHFSSELRANKQYSCPLFDVSDLWGVLPGNIQGMRDYLNPSPANTVDPIPSTPFLSLLMHTRSGATLSNIANVNRNISQVLGEGDRHVYLSGGTTDPDTRVQNVLCVNETGHDTDHARVARLAFPAVSAVAESPVVLDCLRYIIEVSWLDMLEVVAGDEIFSDSDEGVMRLRAQSEENIETWRERCNIKLRKLDTCHHQAAYEVDIVRATSVGFQHSDCLYTEDPESKDIAIMHTECVVVVRGSKKLYDVRLCPAVVDAAVASEPGDPVVVTLAMLVDECEVVHALRLLQQANESALPETPLLSERFVRQVIGEQGSGERTPGGVLGLHRDEDFLFPSEKSDTEAQCFPTVPYWPVAWQAPFGEIVSDLYDHATGFSNYMMLVCSHADGECNADGNARIVLMPDHLRVENMTSTLFGTGGFCREHSFAMPLVRTNTHAICTDEDVDGITEDQSHVGVDIDATKCSSTPRVSAGGGTGAALGNMWPLLRHFVSKRDDFDGDDSSMIDDDAIVDMLSRLQSDENYTIMPVLSTDENLEEVVGTLCMTTDNYRAQESPVQTDPDICTANSGCNTEIREVCNAGGKCVEVTVEVTHEYEDEDNVEFGLSVPYASGGCTSTSPPPSPWEQYASFLEQHGMCSHSNAVSYERMLAAMSSGMGECKDQTGPARSICESNNMEWDWTTQIPWNWRGNGAGDTTNLHEYTQTVKEAMVYELERHACDADYMHTPGVMHMCQLDVSDTDSGNNYTHRNTHWMRHGKSEDDTFTTMRKDPETDCFNAATTSSLDCIPYDENGLQDKETANKLRFMAIDSKMMNFVEDNQNTNLVQPCGEFDVCQPEFFTFGGKKHHRRNSNDNWNAEQGMRIRRVADTKRCRSIGYIIDDGNSETCVLDRHTAALAYVLLTQNSNSRCSELYRDNVMKIKSLVSYDSDTDTATYAEKETLAVLALLNDVFWVHKRVRHASISRDLPANDIDFKGRELFETIHTCANDVQDFLDKLRAGEQYNMHGSVSHKTSGLYYFYEYGTYEVPLLWWLKYCVQTIALDYTGGDVNTVDVTGFALDAYDNRASGLNLQTMWSDRGVTLKTIWMRANTRKTVSAARVREIVSSAITKQWSEKFQNDEYELRCPTIITIPVRTYSEPIKHESTGECKPEGLAHDLFSSTYDGVPVPFVNANGTKNVPAMHEQFENPIMGINNNPTCSYRYNTPRTTINTPRIDRNNDPSFKLIFHVIAEFMRTKDVVDVSDPFDGKHRNEQFRGKNDEIPVAMVTLSSLNLKQILSANIKKIAKKMLDEKQKTCNANVPKNLVGQKTLRSEETHNPCTYDRFELESMKREGQARGWTSEQQKRSATQANIYTGSTATPITTIDLCRRHNPQHMAAERKFWGRQHPDREDGMPCSMYDAMHRTGDEGACDNECTNTNGNMDYNHELCHKCARMKTTVFDEYVDIKGSVDTAIDRKCTFHDNSDNVGPLFASSTPELLERDQEYIFNADVYRGDLSRSGKSRRGICHRIDSGCVTRHEKERLQKLFTYNENTLDSPDVDPEHPVQAAYERVNRNAYTQVSVPRLEEHSIGKPSLSYNTHVVGARIAKPGSANDEITDLDDLGDWWKRDQPMNNIDGVPNANFDVKKHHRHRQDPASSHTGMQCNARKIDWPAKGVDADIFTLNKEELPLADYAHVLYNDRVAFTRFEGKQVLFGHHFPDNGRGRDQNKQNTMGAPPWSFCETGEDIDGAIHWFRPEDFTDKAKKRVASNLYRWDQKLGYESTKGSNEHSVSRSGLTTDTSKIRCGEAEYTQCGNKQNYEYINEFVTDGTRQTESSKKFMDTTIYTNLEISQTATPVIEDPNDIGEYRCTRGSPPQCTVHGTLPVKQGVCTSLDETECLSAYAGIQETYDNSKHATCSGIPVPDNMDGFGVFDLAVCWEQDVYEPANIRPWWSLSVSEMMMNFMDGSTNTWAFTHWLNFQIPETFSMRELMYPYMTTSISNIDPCWMGRGAPGIQWKTDSDGKFRYCDVRKSGTLHEQISPSLTGLASFEVNDLQIIYNSGWENMIAVVNMPIFTTFHKELMRSEDTPPINKILGRHLWFYKDMYSGFRASAPLRFAPCIPDFDKDAEATLEQRGYEHLRPAAQVWDTKKYLKFGGDKKRYITKPTQWAEMDGSPGTLLVPCHPDCVIDENSPPEAMRKHHKTVGSRSLDHHGCGKCRPLFLKVPTPATQTWSATPSGGGACSYSMQLKHNHVCSSLHKHAFEDDQEECAAAVCGGGDEKCAEKGIQKSFYPVAGKIVENSADSDDEDMGAIFMCGECQQYDPNFVILTNDRTSEDVFEHCAGCGLYKPNNIELTELLGPYNTDTIEDVTKELNSRIDTLFEDAETLAGLIETQIETDSRIERFEFGSSHELNVKTTVQKLQDDEKTISVSITVKAGKLAPINTGITDQFDMFGTNTPRRPRRCKLNKRHRETSTGNEDCRFRVGFDSKESGAHTGAFRVRDMIVESCQETQGIDEIQGVLNCASDITANRHLTRLRSFAEDVLRKEYGMAVPVLGYSKTRALKSSMPFSWHAGVLPFYTNENRGHEVFLEHLLDFETQCEMESKANDIINVRPCIKNSDDSISIVNPWLGGNYSFYKTKYDLVFDPSAENEKKVRIGFDMCQVPDSAHSSWDIIPCAARACLDNADADVDVSVCNLSTVVSESIRDELPPRSAQEYLAKVRTPDFVYTPRPAQGTCEKTFARGHAACDHTQAPLGYMPGDIVRGTSTTTTTTPGPELTAARLLRDEFWVGHPGTGLADSMWAGIDARTHISKRKPHVPLAPVDGAAYALLAVRRTQLAPDYVRLTIDGYGVMKVSEVGLRAGRNAGGSLSAIPHKLWPASAAQAVFADNTRIDANPVYAKPCVSGSVCRVQHWACMYVRNGLFGASSAMRGRHGSLRLMTPDPPRMQELFGPVERLGRAHPLVAVRDVTGGEMHGYAQIGLALFVRRECASRDKHVETVRNHIKKAIRDTAYALVTHSHVENSGCLRENTNPLDWPWVDMDLRSGEKMGGRNATTSASKVRRDQYSRMKSFKIWVSTNGIMQNEAPSRSTLDRGGDCHREYIPRVTEAELEDLKNFEKCYVVDGTHDMRMLRCENSVGGLPDKNFSLNTTRPQTRNLAQLHAAAPTFLKYKACRTHTALVAKHPNTSLHTHVLESEHPVPAHDAELSLSRRQRISPLWRLVEQRTRGTAAVYAKFNTQGDTAAVGAGGKAQSAAGWWAQSEAHRRANPRWQTDPAVTNRSARADLSHMVRGVHSRCAGLADSVEQKFTDEWSTTASTRRDAHCLAVLQHIDDYKEDNNCSGTTPVSRDFDICSLTDMQPLCARLAQFSAQVADVNAWASRQTEHTAMLYTPSVFMRGDGMFVWHAVASSYDELIFTQEAQCPDVDAMYSGRHTQGANQALVCPGADMMSVAKMLKQLRIFVVDIVAFIMDILKIVFEFILGVIYSLMLPEGSQKEFEQVDKAMGHAFEQSFSLFTSLIDQAVELFHELMHLVIKWIQNSPLEPLLSVIETLCSFVKMIGKVVIDVAAIVKTIADWLGFKFGHQDHDHPQHTIQDSMDALMHASCRLHVDECGEDEDDADCVVPDIFPSRQVASTCGVRSLGENAPLDVMNGFSSKYQCMPTSYCIEDIFSGFAVLCANCRTPAGEEGLVRTNFQCDMATDQCTCGAREQKTSECYTNSDCKLAGKICAIKDSVHSSYSGTQECVDGRGSSFCYRDSADNTIGQCTLFATIDMDSTVGCQQSEINTHVYLARTGACLGTNNVVGANPIVEESALFLYQCSNNAHLGAAVLCMRVVPDSGSVVFKAVWAEVPGDRFSGRGGRRLLDESGNTGGGAVLEFLRVAGPRLDDAADTSGCKSPLRDCMDAGRVSAGCKLCAALWLFWNITLTDMHAPLNSTLADTDMFDAREAVVHLIFAPAVGVSAAVRAPHALLVLFEDWMHNAAAFRYMVGYMRDARDTAVRFATHARDIPTYAHTTRRKKHARITPTVPTAPARSLLAVEGGVSKVFANDAKHPDMSNIVFLYAPVATKHKNLVYSTGILELPAGLNCIVTGSAVVNHIVYYIIKSFEREGWKTKDICDSDSTYVLTCPLLDGAVSHVVESTKILVKYYAYMAYQTDCLSNMYHSCLPRAATSFTLVSEAFPRIRPRALTPPPERTSADKGQDDVVVDNALRGLRWALNALTISKGSIESTFLGFVSLDPMYNDTLYASMRAKNEFSLGSIARDLIVCDLDETLSCRSRNSPLLVVIVTNFLLIGLLVVLLPIPSVFVFFIWTMGMTIGVVYIAYGFSPLCLPRVPVCLAEGLFDVVQKYIIPKHILLSQYLYDADVCDASMVRKGIGVCLRSCVAAPISVDRVSSVFVALDCAVFRYKALVTRYVVSRLPTLVTDLYDVDSFSTTISHFEAIFSGADEDLKSAVHVCILVNIFKVVLCLCVAILVLPVFFYAVQLVFTLTATVIVKTIALVIELGKTTHAILLY